MTSTERLEEPIRFEITERMIRSALVILWSPIELSDLSVFGAEKARR